MTRVRVSGASEVPASAENGTRHCSAHPAGGHFPVMDIISKWIAKVFAGGLRMAQELLDDLRVFSGHVIIFVNVLSQVEKLEFLFALRLAPVALLGVHGDEELPVT